VHSKGMIVENEEIMCFQPEVALLCPNFINTATLLEIDQDLIYTKNHTNS
jgi:hypothetical protein